MAHHIGPFVAKARRGFETTEWLCYVHRSRTEAFSTMRRIALFSILLGHFFPALAGALEPRILVLGVWPNRVRFLDEATEEFVGEMTLRYGAITTVFGADRTTDSRRFFFVTDRMEAVEVVDVPSRRVVDEVKLSSPERRVRIYAAAPDAAGRMLFLTVEAVGLEVDRFLPETVDVVQYDLETDRVVQSFALPDEIPAVFLPPLVRVAPDGKSLYLISGDIYRLDVETHEIVDRILLSKTKAPGYGPPGLGFLPVEAEPGVLYGFYRSPDPVLKKTMFGITRVDLSRREVDRFDLSPDVNVEWLGVSPDGKRAYAGMGDLVAIDLESRKLIARRERVEQGRQNVAIVVSYDGKKLFVGGVGPNIDVYDASTLERVRRIHAGADVMNPPQPIPRTAFER
jgi:DNA-binding beta-propeller fold protein YncE